MFAALLELLSGLWGPSSPETHIARDTRKRANRAYAAAWAARGHGESADQANLLHELQARNVPGSFSTPTADPVLGFYFDRLRAGVDPKSVRAEAAKRHTQ
jgi:hypothetical protein